MNFLQKLINSSPTSPPSPKPTVPVVKPATGHPFLSYTHRDPGLRPQRPVGSATTWSIRGYLWADSWSDMVSYVTLRTAPENGGQVHCAVVLLVYEKSCTSERVQTDFQ